MAAFALKACELKGKLLKLLHGDAGRGAEVAHYCQTKQASTRKAADPFLSEEAGAAPCAAGTGGTERHRQLLPPRGAAWPPSPCSPSAVFLTSYATVLSLLISIAKHWLGDELFSNASAVIYTNTFLSKGKQREVLRAKAPPNVSGM